MILRGTTDNEAGNSSSCRLETLQPYHPEQQQPLLKQQQQQQPQQQHLAAYGINGDMVQTTVLGDPNGYPHIYAGQYAASPYSTTQAAQSLYNGQMPYPASTPTVVSSRADNPYTSSSATAQGGMMPGVTAHSQPQQNGNFGSGSAAPACVYLCNRELWVKFYQHTTEMIITKQGR